MALVMLPCDLPWWSSVCKRLSLLEEADDIDVILGIMQKIHDLCNVSLDPDEDQRDATLFDGLRNFLTSDMDADECKHFKLVTLRNLAKRAQSLRSLRPPRGLSFSLQQQPDKLKLNYSFIASLLANAFFSTFPKRTEKTHPTLQDFNFTYFFKNLHLDFQKTKFRSFLKYFDWLDSTEQQAKEQENGENATIANEDDDKNTIKISRKVFSGKQWLTIEDWLECTLPLCSLEIKHEGRIERSHENIVQTVFASPRLGGKILSDGDTQECYQFAMFPELLAILLYVEAIEDNETLLVEDIRQINRIMTDSSKQTHLETLEEPRKVSLCLMDPEDYSSYPVAQFEEDNILRELNKCLLAFRQNTTCPVIPSNTTNNISRRCNSTTLSMTTASGRENRMEHNNSVQRRLSPIGESGRSSPKDVTKIIIKQPSTSTKKSSYDSGKIENDIDKRRSWLSASPAGGGSSSKDGGSNVPSVVTGPTASGRRGRFIVLGSSGECLPVNRKLKKRPTSVPNAHFIRTDSNSIYSSCNSSDVEGEDEEKYFSAKTSFDEFLDVDDRDYENKYCKELDTAEKRYTFAEKLREALRHSDEYTESTDDSYAVDISISGSRTDADEGIRIRRGGSRGFVLTEDSLDEEFYMQSINQEQDWIKKFRTKYINGPSLATNNLQTDKNANITIEQKPKYSFDGNSSEFSSELEEVYEQFSKWLDDPIIKDNAKTLDSRDEAVLKFASSLLKRTLSESFVGVPLTDGCMTSTCIPAEENSLLNYQKQKNRQILNSRSLSLELAKHKHRLAAQLNKNISVTLSQSVSSLTESSNTSSTASTVKEFDIVSNQFKSKHNPTKPPLRWSITPIQTEQIIICDTITVKISQIGKTRTGKDGMKPVATGNWGCGNACRGDVQLKLVIQWMAASVAGLPVLVYYTAGHEKLAKLDTVCRVLIDRKWTVSELASATLIHAKDTIDYEETNDPTIKKYQRCFFEKLIGI